MQDSQLIEDFIPTAWAWGLVRLCPPTEHTHGERQADGTWVQRPCGTPGKRPMEAAFNSKADERWRSGRALRAAVEAAQEMLHRGDNVGMVPPPGVVVIDCDTEHTVEWMRSIVLPGTPIMQRTPASAHFYVRIPDGLALKAKRIAWSVDDAQYAFDLRCPAKSQVVIPPSKHKSGVHYAWAVPLPDSPNDVPAMPPELEDLLRHHHVERRDAERRRAADEIPGHDRIRSYANRWCRYLTNVEDVRERVHAYAREVYAERPERRDAACAPGGEVDRVVDTGWDRFGGQAPLDHDQTDSGYAQLFMASSGDWAYDPTSKCWYHHERGLWSRREETWLEREVGALNRKLLDDAAREQADPGRRDRLLNMSRALRGAGRVRSIVRRLQAECAFDYRGLDAAPGLVAMGEDAMGKRHALELSTMQLRETTMEDRFTREMGSSLNVVGWDPEALDMREKLRARWVRFLVDTFQDPELIAFVHRAAGMSMLGEGKAHAIFFLYGRGGSGKSTFLNVLMAAFGSYTVKAGFATFVGDKTVNDSAASPDIARLAGARLVVCSEIPQRAMLGARMKDLTGGDRLVARHLYGNPIEFTPRFTAWVAGNVAPESDFLDSGVERRLKILPADHPCARPDPTLVAVFGGEIGRSVIVEWVVEGLRAFHATGLGTCPQVARAAADYWAEMNPVEEWFAACCKRGPGEVGSTELYARFLGWVEETHGLRASNSSSVPNATRFGKALGRLGPTCFKGPKGRRMWKGVMLVGVAPETSYRKLPNLKEN